VTVVVTGWKRLERKSTRRRRGGTTCAVVDVSIGQCVIDLELTVKASDSNEWINRVEYLPLK